MFNIQEAHEKLYHAIFHSLKSMPEEDVKVVIKEFTSAPPLTKKEVDMFKSE